MQPTSYNLNTHTHARAHIQNTKCFQICEEGMLDETEEEKKAVRNRQQEKKKITCEWEL
jgi:hypothetical protein